jgi:uncharacterized protein (DUF488 family)
MTMLHTIGFGGKDLESFVRLLRASRVTKVIDARLRPNSQLSGYARGGDLRYVLTTYEGIEYEHRPDLAPTAPLLDAYRKTGDWLEYVRGFECLIGERDMPRILMEVVGSHDSVALLCSEATPEQCHRRLVAEAYVSCYPTVEVMHL